MVIERRETFLKAHCARGGVGEDVTLLHQLEILQRNRCTYRMPGIGEAVTKDSDLTALLDERFIHPLGNEHGADGEIR